MHAVTTETMPSLTTTVCPRLGVSLQGSLLQIVGYRSLVAEVEKLRREAYDCENVQHEEMLLKVQNHEQQQTLGPPPAAADADCLLTPWPSSLITVNELQLESRRGWRC